MSAYRATWVCPHCMKRNPPARTDCQACGVAIPAGGPE